MEAFADLNEFQLFCKLDDRCKEAGMYGGGSYHDIGSILVDPKFSNGTLSRVVSSEGEA